MGEIDWEGLKAQLAELDNLELRDQDLPDDEEEDDDEEGLYDYDSYESDDNDDGLSDYYGYEGADSEEDKKALIEATKESLVQLGGQDIADKYGKYLTEEDAIKNASVLYPEKRTYRSLLLDVFTPDQMIEIHKITKTFSISNNQKMDIIKEKLNEWGIKNAPLGPGTNRYGFMTDGYVVKVAFDKDGKIDNKREFIYSMALQPYVIKCYETTEDGLFAIFEYVESFTIDDFWQEQERMRAILKNVARSYLIGDVGVSSKNYENWAHRDNGECVMLDYAYIYSVAFKHFTCTCRPDAVLYYDKDFVNLLCPVCGKKYSFADVRRKISRKEQDEEIGDILQKGIVLTAPEMELDFNPKFTLGAIDAIMHKLMKRKKKDDKKLIRRKKKSSDDEYIMSIDEITEAIRRGDITE